MIFRDPSNTGHSLTLEFYQTKFGTDIRKKSFTERMAMLWIRLPREGVESIPWKCSKILYLWHSGPWFSGEHEVLTAALNDLRRLFQSEQFCHPFQLLTGIKRPLQADCRSKSSSHKFTMQMCPVERLAYYRCQQGASAPASSNQDMWGHSVLSVFCHMRYFIPQFSLATTYK